MSTMRPKGVYLFRKNARPKGSPFLFCLMGVNDHLAKCFKNLTTQSLTTSTMSHKGVYLFREKCQTKGLTISVLLDGSERPLSKMLEESLKQQKTRSPCPQ